MTGKREPPVVPQSVAPHALPTATTFLLGLAFFIATGALVVMRSVEWLGGGMLLLAILIGVWARIIQAGVHHAEVMTALTHTQRIAARGWRA